LVATVAHTAYTCLRTLPVCVHLIGLRGYHTARTIPQLLRSGSTRLDYRTFTHHTHPTPTRFGWTRLVCSLGPPTPHCIASSVHHCTPAAVYDARTFTHHTRSRYPTLLPAFPNALPDVLPVPRFGFPHTGYHTCVWFVLPHTIPQRIRSSLVLLVSAVARFCTVSLPTFPTLVCRLRYLRSRTFAYTCVGFALRFEPFACLRYTPALVLLPRSVRAPCARGHDYTVRTHHICRCAFTRSAARVAVYRSRFTV